MHLSQSDHDSNLVFVEVRDQAQRGPNHFDAVLPKEVILVFDQLFPETKVWPDDGPAGFDPVVGVE